MRKQEGPKLSGAAVCPERRWQEPQPVSTEPAISKPSPTLCLHVFLG